MVALAIVIDKLSEGLSMVNHRIERSGDGGGEARRILGWTGLVGAALFGAALA